MTGSLAREQLRAQRGALITATALIAITVALTTFAVLTAATQRVVSTGGYEHTAEVAVTTRGTAVSYGEVTARELDAMAASIAADADRAVISQGFSVWALKDTNVLGQTPQVIHISALTGNPEWAGIMIDGTAPQPGQIVFSTAQAERLAVRIGDEVLISGRENDPSSASLTVSGISRGEADGPLYSSAPDGYANWADAGALARLEPSDPGWALTQWDSPSATLDDFQNFMSVHSWSMLDAAQPASAIAAIAALAMAAATVAAAFGLGRAQAQARTQWVATARALGATRASVTRAALVEWGVLTVAGAALGVALGYGALVGALALQRASEEQPALPSLPSTPPGVVAALVGLAALLAGIIALVPALWARQVEPAEALKDSTPVTERTAPRTVPTWGLFLALSAATAIYWELQFAYTTSPQFSWAFVFGNGLWWVVPAIIGLLALTLAARALRAGLRAAGRRLATSANPVRATAGDVLATRASAVAGLVVAPWGAASVALVLLSNPEGLGTSVGGGTGSSLLVGTLAVMAGVAHVAARASLGAGRAEWAARRALGLSAADARRALGWIHAVSLGLGVAMGAVVAAAVVWAVTVMSDTGPALEGVVDALWPVLLLATPVVALAAVLFAVMAGSLAGTPARERVHAGGVG